MNQDFVKVALKSEISEGSLKTVSLGDEKVTIANTSGQYHAIGAICTHAQVDLADGELNGETIICAGHGAVWNLKTGEGTFPRPLPPEPLYEVKVDGSDILIRPK